MVEYPFIQTNKPSTKFFALEDGHATAGSNVDKLHYNVREPACTVDMLLTLKDNSLLSASKFYQAGCIVVCDVKKVNLYNGKTARITVSEEAVLKGWRRLKSNLWHIPHLNSEITNDNNQTLLINENLQPQDPDIFYLRPHIFSN